MERSIVLMMVVVVAVLSSLLICTQSSAGRQAAGEERLHCEPHWSGGSKGCGHDEGCSSRR